MARMSQVKDRMIEDEGSFVLVRTETAVLKKVFIVPRPACVPLDALMVQAVEMNARGLLLVPASSR